MRLFLAIDIPKDRAFEDLYNGLRALDKRLGPVHPTRQHITLKFLGDPGVSEGEIIETLSEIGHHHAPFNIEVTEAGAFSNWKRPSIFWLGLSSIDQLKGLASDTDRTLHERIGSDLEKRGFRAHITVARYRGRGPLDTHGIRSLMEKAVMELKRKEYCIDVDRFHLISSRLTPQGPIYTKLHTFHLSKERPVDD